MAQPVRRGYLIVATALLLLAACSGERASPAVEPQIRTASDVAAPASLIPRALLFGNPTRAQGRISPDGRWLSWLAPVAGVLNVHVAPVADPTAVRVLTEDRGRGINRHFWSFDSESILYLQDQGGNENTHLYAVPVAGGAVRALTPVGDEVRVMIEALSPRLPGVVLVGMNDRDSSLFDLHRIEIASGERTLVAENPGFLDWTVDLNLNPRAALRESPGGGREVLRRDADGTWSPLTTIPREDALTTQLLAITDDDQTAILLDSRDRDLTVLSAIDLVTGELRVLGEHPRADVSDVLLHPATDQPVAFAGEYLEQDWRALDPTFDPHLKRLTAELGGSLQFVASTLDFKQLLVYADQAQVPGGYFRYDVEQRKLEALFTTRPELEDQPLQPTEAVAIEARDGLRLVSYLTRPAGPEAAAVPMVLLVHGGPWARDSGGFNSLHQWLANRGYAVLSVNYRGSTGFGKQFLNAAVREFAGAMHDDLIDAVRWAIDEGIADPERIAIMGGSYGGYATLVGLTFTPETFACGVDLVGPSSLVTLVESFPDYWAPFLENSWFKFVGNPADESERADMLNRSPITRVADIQVPLLIGQGENDPRVTKLESDQLVAAMEAREQPVTYLNYPDEGHGFVRPENRLSFWATAEGFLTQCLGGRAEPIGDAFAGSSVQVLAGASQVPGLPEVLEALAAQEAPPTRDASNPQEVEAK